MKTLKIPNRTDGTKTRFPIERERERERERIIIIILGFAPPPKIKWANNDLGGRQEGRRRRRRRDMMLPTKKQHHHRAKKVLCVFGLVCVVFFSGKNNWGSGVFANQKARAKTVAASVEREVHEHVLEPIAHGLEGMFFGAAEEDGEEEKVDYDDDDDVDDDTDETVAADANADVKYREENEKAEMHDEDENQEADRYEVATMEKNAQIEREVRQEDTARKASNMPKAFAIHQGNAKCANAPKEMLPKFTKQSGLRKKESKVLPAKAGYVGVSRIDGATKGTVRVRTENGPRTKMIESSANPTVKNKDEEALITCLEDLSKCQLDSENDSIRKAAWKLGGTMDAKLGKSLAGIERKKTCAIIGNGGALMAKEYGQYIDKHDVVVRINVLDNNNAKFNASLGQKATHRVLSYKMSKDVCCLQPASKHPPDNDELIYLAWFPAMRKQLISRLAKRQKRKVIEMHDAHLKSIIHSFKKMREELVRLGFGPFEDWEYMTSGMHAVLTFARSCETVDVYGFTTDSGGKEPYWFTGRKVAPRSGRTQHAWDHERMILRLLAASGIVNVCT